MRPWQLTLIVLAASFLSFIGGSVSDLSDWASMFRGRSAFSVVDGDTIRLGTQSLRLANIDAPETRGPDCDEERALGQQATQRLRALISKSGFSITPNGRIDKYGRPLVAITIDGADAGQTLIAEGLARPWSGKSEVWCPAPAP